MIDQAIVLVGGRGTRLKSVVDDVPKPMALIHKRPFLYYLISKLKKEGIAKVVLAVGYKHEIIQDYFGSDFKGLEILYSIENEPLGTGGAIKQAFKLLKGPAFVFNGDAFFNISFELFEKKFNQVETDIVIALKRDKAFDRYGNVTCDAEDRILSFQEKGFVEEGTFNGGVYIIHPRIWDKIEVGDKFSFETDVMEAHVSSLHFYAQAFDNYFIDIGIPKDYAQANLDFAFFEVDASWTIFLDRDGVINQLRHNDYVKTVSEFQFIDGSKQMVADLSQQFKYLFVVTNQQGVGKKMMTASDLEIVHQYLDHEIKQAGGAITKIYHCPQVESDNPDCRKPNTGMGKQAKGDYPNVDFSKSIMIGDTDTDMEFGQRLQMRCIRIGEHTDTSIHKVCGNLKEAGAFLLEFSA